MKASPALTPLSFPVFPYLATNQALQERQQPPRTRKRTPEVGTLDGLHHRRRQPSHHAQTSRFRLQVRAVIAQDASLLASPRTQTGG